MFLTYTDMKYFNITVIQNIYDIFLTYRDRKIPKKQPWSKQVREKEFLSSLGGFVPGVATQNRQRFWTKPHFIAVDEPTNYLDVETVEALSKALMGG